MALRSLSTYARLGSCSKVSAAPTRWWRPDCCTTPSSVRPRLRPTSRTGAARVTLVVAALPLCLLATAVGLRTRVVLARAAMLGVALKRNMPKAFQRRRAVLESNYATTQHLQSIRSRSGRAAGVLQSRGRAVASSISESASAAATARPSSPRRASSRFCSGACSPAARATLTSKPSLISKKLRLLETPPAPPR